MYSDFFMSRPWNIWSFSKRLISIYIIMDQKLVKWDFYVKTSLIFIYFLNFFYKTNYNLWHFSLSGQCQRLLLTLVYIKYIVYAICWKIPSYPISRTCTGTDSNSGVEEDRLHTSTPTGIQSYIHMEPKLQIATPLVRVYGHINPPTPTPTKF